MQNENFRIIQLFNNAPNSISQGCIALPPRLYDGIAKSLVSNQLSVNLTFTAALGSIVTATSQTIDVVHHINQCISPTTMFFLTIAETGAGKSTLMNHFFSHLRKFHAEQTAESERLQSEYQADLAIWTKTKQVLVEMAAKSPDDFFDSLRQAVLDHELQKPTKPRVSFPIFEDATMPALLRQLHDSGGVGCILSAEGGNILSSQAYKQTTHLNSAYSGEDMTVNRISTESFTIRSPRLSGFISAQPVTLEGFLSTHPEARANGLLPRSAICMAEKHHIGNRTFYPNSTANLNLGQEFDDRMQEIVAELKQSIQQKKRHVIKLDSNSLDLMTHFVNDIEFNIAPGRTLSSIKEFAIRLPEFALRLAANLQYFERGTLEIERDILDSAIAISMWYASQFATIPMLEDHSVKLESVLSDWLYNAAYLKQYDIEIVALGNCLHVRKSDILRYGPYRLRNVANLNRALRYLAESNTIQIIDFQRTKFVALNPSIFGQLPVPVLWANNVGLQHC